MCFSIKTSNKTEYNFELPTRAITTIKLSDTKHKISNNTNIICNNELLCKKTQRS